MELKSLDKVSNLTPDQFVSQYMKQNIPIILEDFVDSESVAFQNGIMIISRKLPGKKKWMFMVEKSILQQSSQQTDCKNDFCRISRSHHQQSNRISIVSLICSP
jgi:hypothetical protein